MILSSIIWLDLCTFRPRSTYIHTSWIQLVGVHLHRDVDILYSWYIRVNGYSESKWDIQVWRITLNKKYPR